MLSPLKNLLCRHDFNWSKRYMSDRCRHYGKTRVVDNASPAGASDTKEPITTDQAWASRTDESAFILATPDEGGPINSSGFDIPPATPVQPVADVPLRRTPSAKVLKAQATERRESLLILLDRLAEGGQPSRRDSLDVVLAVIEDAHSADPVLFGSGAAGHFARLHEARSGLIF